MFPCNDFQRVFLFGSLKERPGKRLYKQTFDPVSNAPAAMSHIFCCYLLYVPAYFFRNVQGNAMFVFDSGKYIIKHAVENLFGNFRCNKVEDNNVIANPVQYFRPIQHKFEVILYGSTHLLLNLLVRITRGDILDP